MVDKIGVLGETTNVAVGSHTVYQVPTGKAARARLMFRCASGTNSTIRFTINGIEQFRSGALTAGHVHYSNATAVYATQTGDAAVTGLAVATTVAPFGTDYWLAAGDTVVIVIGTADLQSNNAQIVGTEVDVV